MSMHNPGNPYRGGTPTVDHLIGRAYPVVKHVSDNMHLLTTLVSKLEMLNEIVQGLPLVQELEIVKDQIVEINNQIRQIVETDPSFVDNEGNRRDVGEALRDVISKTGLLKDSANIELHTAEHGTWPLSAWVQELPQITQPAGNDPLGGFDDYSKVRSYSGRATRMKVQDATGMHWWVRRGAALDNGGTVLKDGLHRSWEREFSGKANVLWFGAVAYGNSDEARYGVDSAGPVKRALAAADEVYAPSGHFRIDEALVIPNNKALRGAGVNNTVIHAGDSLMGLNMIESQSVHVASGPTDSGIVLSDFWMIGGWGVALARGIELGCRDVGAGGGCTFNLSRIAGNYLHSGIRINGGTYSEMDSITLNGLDERSSGFGIEFTGYTNNVLWTSGLVGDFGRNIVLSGDAIVMVNVNSGTAVDGAYGEGWRNTWTQSLLSIWEARNVKLVNFTFEHLSKNFIDEVEINSFSANSAGCFDVTLEDCRWMGVNSWSRSRLRLGASGASYKKPRKINLVRPTFLQGVPLGSGYQGDIWIDNAFDVDIVKPVRLANYQDSGSAPAVISYTLGTAADNNIRISYYKNTSDRVVIGASGAPAYQNGWTAYGDSSFESASYYFDNQGAIHLEGMASNNAPENGVVVFYLPAGCRPSKRLRFSSFGFIGGGNISPIFIDIAPGGDVRFYYSGSIAEVSLSGVCFYPAL